MNTFEIAFIQCPLAEAHRFGDRICAICSKPLLSYREAEELYRMVCEKFSTYLPEYQMHILPFYEVLLICNCIFVVEFLFG